MYSPKGVFWDEKIVGWGAIFPFLFGNYRGQSSDYGYLFYFLLLEKLENSRKFKFKGYLLFWTYESFLQKKKLFLMSFQCNLLKHILRSLSNKIAKFPVFLELYCKSNHYTFQRRSLIDVSFLISKICVKITN